MRKSFYYFLGIFGILIVIALAIFFAMGGITGFAVNDHGVLSQGDVESTQVALTFKDKDTGCFLEGQVFVDGRSLGQTQNGAFALNEADTGSELSLKGVTSGCFGNDSGLNFVDYWRLPSMDSYFTSGRSLVLETSLDPRNPASFEEVKGFVRPGETKIYLDEITKYFKEDYESNLDRIVSYPISYRYDSVIYSDSHWQTPFETLKLKRGDCEDWAVAILSMIKEYNPDAQCYGVLWQSHMSVLCYVDGKYIIYDQGNTKIVKTLSNESELENKVELRKFLGDYFDSYGISAKGQKVQGVVSSDSFKTFNNNEEFVDWLLSFEQ